MRPLCLALAFICLCASVATSATVTVNIVDQPSGDFAFVPQRVYLALGDTVKWVNQSSSSQTSTSGATPTPDGLWNSPSLANGGTFSHTFTSMGAFRYFSSTHTGVTGLVRVTRAVVKISNFVFTPASLAIGVGDTVTWLNTTPLTTHTSTSGAPLAPDGKWDSGFLGPGASFSHAFSATGSNPYYCNVHHTMTASITVGAAAGVGETQGAAFHLLAPVPNPARREVRLGFELAEAGRARLSVVDAAGRRVASLFNGGAQAGPSAFVWNGLDSRGRTAPAGAYFARLTVGGRTASRAFTWLR